jgi:sulfhydrogenase subunit alpha
MTEKRNVRIEVPVLARVEGEGALLLSVRDGHIDELKLRIYEPPRFFEKFLEGRDHQDVIDAVARICGICPVAYQMSAAQALERVFGVQLPAWAERMRRVFYCGEWLQSHALHVHLLAAPDFLGTDSVLGMAQTHPEEVKRGLRLQSLGNALIALFGGRSVHPVGVRVGGFHHAPTQAAVDDMLERLRAALPEAEALVAWTASLPLPESDQDFVSVSLRHPEEYPLYSGRIVSSAGLDIDVEEYEAHFVEEHAPHSTALHAKLHGEPYLVGPLARLNLNLDRLPEPVRAALERTGIEFPSRNTFHSVVARAVEIHLVIFEAIRLLEDYVLPDQPAAPFSVRAGNAAGASEAPRGLLWHRYGVGEDGLISAARIVPPTSQNQARIEEDLRLSLEACGLEQADDVLRLHGEMVIRNYDPCISCATHFLRLEVDRGCD